MLAVSELRLGSGSGDGRFNLTEGEICVLLGRNHSGKTNLLRLIAGLPSDASGLVKIQDKEVNAEHQRDRDVAFVFQAFVNYPHWTVRQNLESPLRAQRLVAGVRRERVQQVAQTLQIDDLLERLPTELSGGQQQRVALGRALCKQASIVLLDEPFVNLDFRLRERLTRELGQLLRDSKTSAVFSSSDSRDAFALADKVALLAAGKLIQFGEPAELYRRPNSLQAADLMSEPGVNYTTTASGLLVVRPEHLSLTRMPDAQAFSIQVEAVETNGSHSFVQGALLAESARRWVAKLVGVPNISVGGELQLYAKQNNILRFADG